jgi:hypothetical protein
MILHESTSRFNGEPFAVIATGIDRPSTNVKTGPMIQLTILPTSQHPVEANRAMNAKTGQAHTVCNDCPLIKNGCYVRVESSISAIYRAYKAKSYSSADYAAFNGQSVRFGAWGEPSLIPLRIIRAIVKRARNWTGYTHQWEKKPARAYKRYLMASVSSLAEKLRANALGWRTFRIVASKAEVLPDEVICPAQTHKVQCHTCGLCRGNSLKAKNVAVLAHGGKASLPLILNLVHSTN